MPSPAMLIESQAAQIELLRTALQHCETLISQHIEFKGYPPHGPLTTQTAEGVRDEARTVLAQTKP